MGPANGFSKKREKEQERHKEVKNTLKFECVQIEWLLLLLVSLLSKCDYN